MSVFFYTVEFSIYYTSIIIRMRFYLQISLRSFRRRNKTCHCHILRIPDRNWDPRCVRGPVASLIAVKDASQAKALEVVAGGKLFNIVVDTEVHLLL